MPSHFCERNVSVGQLMSASFEETRHEHSYNQPCTQHFGLLGGSETLCSAKDPRLRAKNDLVTHLAASFLATPWPDVSCAGRRLPGHPIAVYSAGGLRRLAGGRAGAHCHSGSRYAGAERAISGMAL